MEKTWEVKEQELREAIATKIENWIESVMPPVDEKELAVYDALHQAAAIARGTK
jgi:hypothetical protein